MRRWLTGAVLGAAVLAAAGCGGGGGGGGPVGTTSTGTTLTATGSLAFTAGEAAAVMGGASCPAAGTTVGLAYAALLASDQGGICGYLQRNQDKAGARSIQVAVVRVDPLKATTSITPGTYPVTESPGAEPTFAVVSVSQSDTTCQPTDVTASGGSVVVSSVTGGRLMGSVDVTLSDGGKLTGAFDAPACAVTFPGDPCAGQLGPQSPTCGQ